MAVDSLFDKLASRFLEVWEAEAGLETYGEAVAEVLEFRASEGETLEMSAEQWHRFAGRASFYAARKKAKSLGVHIVWDCEHAKTPEGYYQVRGGIGYAIAKSLAAAPFADIVWMETATANLGEARQFAEAVHAEFPDKMLAYNLSPFQLGLHGDERRRHAPLPRGAGQDGLRFQLHHLRRPSD